MMTLTYGTVPNLLDIEDAFSIHNSTNDLYEITLRHGSDDYVHLDMAGLLSVERMANQFSRQQDTGRYVSTRLFCQYTPEQLHRLLENLAELWATDDDASYADWAGDFASSILTTLGFEWI